MKVKNTLSGGALAAVAVANKARRTMDEAQTARVQALPTGGGAGRRSRSNIMQACARPNTGNTRSHSTNKAE